MYFVRNRKCCKGKNDVRSSTHNLGFVLPRIAVGSETQSDRVFSNFAFAFKFPDFSDSEFSLIFIVRPSSFFNFQSAVVLFFLFAECGRVRFSECGRVPFFIFRVRPCFYFIIADCVRVPFLQSGWHPTSVHPATLQVKQN